MDQGIVLRIERISPSDGQGLRTVIYFKGCPLRCAWCSTPESQSSQPEWFCKSAKCQQCGDCIIACPQSALSFSGPTVIRDKSKCTNCFKCASVCLSHAIGIYGKTMTIDQVMKEIRKDTLSAIGIIFFGAGGDTG